MQNLKKKKKKKKKALSLRWAVLFVLRWPALYGWQDVVKIQELLGD